MNSNLLAAVKSLLGLLILCISTSLSAQNITIQGKITDRITNKPIPFVSIGYGNSVAVTNENGEFIFTADGLPVSLNIRHLAYRDTVIDVKSNTANVELTEAKRVLEEVTVSNLGSKIMRDLYQQISQSKATFSATGFYRQIITNDNTFTTLIETFSDLTVGANQNVLKYKITNGRYGVRKEEENEGFLKYNNFSYMVFGIKPFSFSKHTDNGKSIGIPLMSNADQYYSYHVLSRIIKEQGEIIEVYCTPNNPERPYFEGSYFVNRSTLEIIKVKGFIKHDLGASVDNANYKTSNVQYDIDMDFTKIGEQTLLNYVEISMTLDFLNKKIGKSHSVEVKGLLLVYNYGDKAKQRRGQKVSIKTNDLEQVKKSDYNAEFWINNPIIKRTPLEESVVADFEKNKYFGTFNGDL